MTRELGYPSGYGPDATAWWASSRAAYVVDPDDPNPDLRFPQSVQAWDLMRRTDSQTGAVLSALTLPILRARWALGGDGVRPEVVDFVTAQLGLGTVDGGRSRRRRQGVLWSRHLSDALLMMPLGFMAFEQVYQAEVGGEWSDRLGQDAVMHLRKLAPRMPSSISAIRVDRDGGLHSIVQHPAPGTTDHRILLDGGVVIPVDRLVMYVNSMEGADWSGVSILRTAYKDWLVKDQLTRINAQAQERNGMGVPKITFTDPAQKAEAERIGREFRAGATAYLALPSSMDAELLGVSGGTRDALPSIQYHDQQIAKSVLAMFLDLGHDAGARSLGETFADLFTDALQAKAEYIADTATEHIIRDLVELNFGEDEPYPVLTCGDLKANATLSVASLVQLAQGGLVTPDDQLESYVRASRGLPKADPTTARVPQSVDPAPVLSEGHDRLAEAHALLERVRAMREQA